MTQQPAKQVHGPTNPMPEQVAASGVRRFGSVWPLDGEHEQLYRDLHADVWPGVLAGLRRAGLRNYSIFITELAGQKYVIGYFEYVGDDFEADQLAAGDDAETKRWLETLSPCELPNIPCSEMDPVFFME